MCASMADIQSATADIRRGKRRSIFILWLQDENIMVCPIPQGDHNKQCLAVDLLFSADKIVSEGFRRKRKSLLMAMLVTSQTGNRHDHCLLTHWRMRRKYSYNKKWTNVMFRPVRQTSNTGFVVWQPIISYFGRSLDIWCSLHSPSSNAALLTCAVKLDASNIIPAAWFYVVTSISHFSDWNMGLKMLPLKNQCVGPVM